MTRKSLFTAIIGAMALLSPRTTGASVAPTMTPIRCHVCGATKASDTAPCAVCAAHGAEISIFAPCAIILPRDSAKDWRKCRQTFTVTAEFFAWKGYTKYAPESLLPSGIGACFGGLTEHNEDMGTLTACGPADIVLSFSNIAVLRGIVEISPISAEDGAKLQQTLAENTAEFAESDYWACPNCRVSYYTYPTRQKDWICRACGFDAEGVF